MRKIKIYLLCVWLNKFTLTGYILFFASCFLPNNVFNPFLFVYAGTALIGTLGGKDTFCSFLRFSKIIKEEGGLQRLQKIRPEHYCDKVAFDYITKNSID